MSKLRFLLWRMRFEWSLVRRRRTRKAYSAASKRGAATGVHNRFARDVLIREKMA